MAKLPNFECLAIFAKVEMRSFAGGGSGAEAFQSDGLQGRQQD